MRALCRKCRRAVQAPADKPIMTPAVVADYRCPKGHRLVRWTDQRARQIRARCTYPLPAVARQLELFP